MNIFEALILGIVQGLTEFLPISSSGHLVIFQKLFGLEEVLAFDSALHFATLVAVFVVLWKDVLEMIKHPFSKLTLLVVVGTIPTMAIGLAFKDIFDELFKSGSTLGLEFILTGLILWYAQGAKNKNKGLKDMSYLDASLVGVAQGIAILPAVSRSGLTIAGSLFRGLDREFAAKFSFLLSIPSIFGAFLLSVNDFVKQPESMEAAGGIAPVAVGMLAAAVAGYFAVKFMMKIISKGNLRIFSYYVFVLGVLIICEQLFVGRIFGRLF